MPKVNPEEMIGVGSHKPAGVPKYDVDEQNRRTSQREVECFKLGMKQRWFAYMGKDCTHITTWVGDVLAEVTWLGDPYKCPAFGGFGSTRVNFRARGIDGRNWYGTFYLSSGDYVRMQACKEKGVTLQ